MTDVRYPGNKTRAYDIKRGQSTLIVRGKVVIAMNEGWTKRWRAGGAIVCTAKTEDEIKIMAMSVLVPWEKGMRGHQFVATCTGIRC